MAITVSIPKEITDYEEKIMFGLSLRKLVFLILTIVVSTGSFFVLTKFFYVSINTAGSIIMLEVIPLVAIGFIKKDGMPFEKYFILFFRHMFGINYFNYETELIVDNFVELVDKEGNGKGEFIYEIIQKENTDKPKYKPTRDDARLTEYAQYKTTEKTSKAKRKEIRRTIKAAEQEFREAKRRIKREV